MPKDDEFRPDLRAQARRGFERANPSASKERYDLNVRAAHIRERMRDHHKKMAPQFVAAERKRLARENPVQVRSALTDGPKPPSLGPSKHFARQDALQARAEANVRKRYELRLHSVDKAERQMVRQMDRKRSRTR